MGLNIEDMVDKIEVNDDPILDAVEDAEELDDLDYKVVQLLLPADTEVVSLTVVRNRVNPVLGRNTSIIATCFPADVDLHDCFTGYSYKKDEEGRLYLVLDNEDDYEALEIPEIDEVEDDEFDVFVKEAIDTAPDGNELAKILDRQNK